MFDVENMIAEAKCQACGLVSDFLFVRIGTAIFCTQFRFGYGIAESHVQCLGFPIDEVDSSDLGFDANSRPDVNSENRLRIDQNGSVVGSGCPRMINKEDGSLATSQSRFTRDSLTVHVRKWTEVFGQILSRLWCSGTVKGRIVVIIAC